jgi:hypothetical protein
MCVKISKIYGSIPGGCWEFFSKPTASRTALGPTQPPIQWVLRALSLGVKRPGREADHSPPSSVEVKEWMELYIHSPNTPSWRGAQLKAQRQLYLTFYGWIVCQHDDICISQRRVYEWMEGLKGRWTTFDDTCPGQSQTLTWGHVKEEFDHRIQDNKSQQWWNFIWNCYQSWKINGTNMA